MTTLEVLEFPRSIPASIGRQAVERSRFPSLRRQGFLGRFPLVKHRHENKSMVIEIAARNNDMGIMPFTATENFTVFVSLSIAFPLCPIVNFAFSMTPSIAIIPDFVRHSPIIQR